MKLLAIALFAAIAVAVAAPVRADPTPIIIDVVDPTPIIID
jgi:hypothetical protein